MFLYLGEMLSQKEEARQFYYTFLAVEASTLALLAKSRHIISEFEQRFVLEKTVNDLTEYL